MISLFRHNLKIVAPTLLWTGILVTLLVALTLLGQFQNSTSFNNETAASLAEQTVPIIAAFFAAGVLDFEMKRGAHELLRSKRRPLWHTVAYRLFITVSLALLIGLGMLVTLHYGIRHVPVGMLMVASAPSALCLALVSLWTRVRLGNAFVGYIVALGAWMVNFVVSLVASTTGIALNPLLTLSSFSERMHAQAAGSLETAPYVDWWWVSKIALLLVSAVLFTSITRRVENLVEAD